MVVASGLMVVACLRTDVFNVLYLKAGMASVFAIFIYNKLRSEFVLSQ